MMNLQRGLLKCLVTGTLLVIAIEISVSSSSSQTGPPDTLPMGIRVYVEDEIVCQQRQLKEYQHPGGDCAIPQWDPGPPGAGRNYYLFDSEYITGTLQQEVGPIEGIAVWHHEALKAMAVAARSYGWYHAFDCGLIDGCDPESGIYGISDSGGQRQGFFPEKDMGVQQSHYDQAATDTAGQYMMHPDGGGIAQVISAEYSKNCGDSTVTYAGGAQRRYLLGIPDPIMAGTTREGNGWGLSQKGAHYWASGYDADGNYFPQWNYLQILVHYYTGIYVRRATTRLTPALRFNVLEMIMTPNRDSIYTEQSYQFQFTIQNTSVRDWHAAAADDYYALSYAGRTAAGQTYTASSRERVNAPIAASTLWQVTVVVADVPETWRGPGELRFDMVYHSPAVQNTAAP